MKTVGIMKTCKQCQGPRYEVDGEGWYCDNCGDTLVSESGFIPIQGISPGMLNGPSPAKQQLDSMQKSVQDAYADMVNSAPPSPWLTHKDKKQAFENRPYGLPNSVQGFDQAVQYLRDKDKNTADIELVQDRHSLTWDLIVDGEIVATFSHYHLSIERVV